MYMYKNKYIAPEYKRDFMTKQKAPFTRPGWPDERSLFFEGSSFLKAALLFSPRVFPSVFEEKTFSPVLNRVGGYPIIARCVPSLCVCRWERVSVYTLQGNADRKFFGGAVWPSRLIPWQGKGLLDGGCWRVDSEDGMNWPLSLWSCGEKCVDLIVRFLFLITC